MFSERSILGGVAALATAGFSFSSVFPSTTTTRARESSM
jgi:hypothetical protein